jgi:hypothetical protein
MLAAVDLNDDLSFETNVIENEPLKWDLSSEFEASQATIP